MPPKRSRKKGGRRGADASAVRKKAAESSSGSSSVNLPAGVSFSKLVKGRMFLDILPYEVTKENHPEKIAVGDMWYSREYGMHFNVGPDERAVLCPKGTFGKRCPICEEYARLKKDVDADEDVVSALKPKRRELFNVVNVEEDRGFSVLDVSFYLFGNSLKTEIQEGDEEIAAFSHPDDGFTLKLRVVENTQLTNAFLEVDRIDFEDREDEVSDEELENAVLLDDALECLEYDELSDILHGKATSSKKKKDDDEEEETPKRRRRKPVAEEEEEAPKRRRRRPAKEEEEEEPAPRRRRRKPAKEDEWEDPGDDPEIEIGSRVSADYDGEAYEGEVTELDGDDATVEFDDGTTEEVKLDDLTLLDAE